MKYQYAHQINSPLISTRILLSVFVLIFTVFIAWSTFQQSIVVEKKLYQRVLAAVAPTGINANGIEMEGRNVILNLGYIQSSEQLNQINQALIHLAGVSRVYNKRTPPVVLNLPASKTTDQQRSEQNHHMTFNAGE